MKTLVSLFLTLLCVPQIALSNSCSVSVRVDDSLRFRPATIEVPAHCSEFKVVLRHVGRLPKVASPRNWVLVDAGRADSVASAASAAGPNNNYVNPEDDRVLASSNVIGRDETTEIEVPVKALIPGNTYTYLSTIPGFSPALRGALVRQPSPN